jgi:hypothetical protein
MLDIVPLAAGSKKYVPSAIKELIIPSCKNKHFFKIIPQNSNSI